MRFPFAPALRSVVRSMNIARFEELINHESIRPTIGGDDVLPMAGIVDNPANYCFESEHGGFVLWSLGFGRYDVHSLFLPEGRGPEAIDAMREVAAYMFTRTDCTEGRTTVPLGNLAAVTLAKVAGFERRFHLQHFPWKAGGTVQAAFYGLTLEKWALMATQAQTAGAWFHAALEAAKLAGDSTRAVHLEDDAHTRVAGATLLMIRGGQAEKAVAFYNTWAMTTRYATIGLISKPPKGPYVVDTGEAVIEANEDGMEILQCR